MEISRVLRAGFRRNNLEKRGLSAMIPGSIMCSRGFRPSFCSLPILLAGAAACLGAAPERSVTFTEEIAPIVFKHCAPCHRPGEAAPFPLLSYDDVKKRSRLIAKVTSEHVMPPWHADESDFVFQDDLRLKPDQIESFRKWFDQGAVEGPASKLPPAPKFSQGWQLGEPDLIVSMSQPFDVPAEGRDIYHSFVIPLDLPEDKWVRGIEFRPSAPSVVHHSLFFYDTTGKAGQMSGRGGAPGFRFLGGDGLGAGSLGGWALGGIPKFLPDGLAFRLPKGASLLLSTHFHPSGKAEQERSTVGIYFAADPPRDSFTGIQLPPAFGALSGVDIPAGAAQYTVKDSFELPIDVEAFGVSGHAHYLGRQMKLTATPPGGPVQNLVWIKNWEFSWQENYAYRDFVKLPKGTRLDVTITWDNSTNNLNNPSHPPKRVRWGPQSEDEMGSMTLLVRAARAAEMPLLQAALRQHAADLTLAAGSRWLRERGLNLGNLVQNLLSTNDRNGDNQLERGEAPRWLARSFDLLDVNHDGVLDLAELEAGEQRLRQRLGGGSE